MARSEPRVKARDKKIQPRKEKSTAPQKTRQGPRSQRCKIGSQEAKGSSLGQYQHCTVSLWETVTRIMAIDLLQVHFCGSTAWCSLLHSCHAIFDRPRRSETSAGSGLTVCHMPWLISGPVLVTRPIPLYFSCSSSRPLRKANTIHVLSWWPPAKKRIPSGSKVLKSNSATSLTTQVPRNKLVMQSSKTTEYFPYR